MADDQTTTAIPDPSALDPALIQQLLQQTLNPQPVAVPQSQQPSPSSHEGRGFLSLLGEALGGGEQYGTTAEREAGGLAALGAMGRNMLANSDYSYQRHTLGSIIGQGMGAAGEALAGRQSVSAAQQAANLDYQQKQQEMQLARVKEAVPLLTLLQTQQQLANARQTALGTTPTSIGAAHTGGIGAVGNPPIIARDPNAGTAGQQANNSGNLMVPPGGSLPTGATGVVPLDGGRQVAAFPDVPTGIAAQSDNLAAYQKLHGINTIAGAVDRWVNGPPSPNRPAGPDLRTYIADIAKMAGVDPNAQVDLTDPKIQRAFFMAQQPHESGKPWLNAADVDKGIALAQARRQGGQPPGAPVVAGAPQTTPPASTAQAAAPAVPGGGGPLTPPGAPRPSPTGAIAEATRNAEVGPLPLPATAGKGTPLPAGNLQTTGKPPGVASNVEAIQAGVNLAQATPVVPSTGLAAGPPGIGQPAALASIVPGGGTGFTPSAPPAVAAPQPIAAPLAQTPPAVQPPAGPLPARVPDQPPPYVRGPLPADIQAQIDHPENYISPDRLTALRTELNSGDISKMAAARSAMGAAAEEVRAKAQAVGEAYHTNLQNIGTEAWKVRRAEQAANDTALQKQAFDERQATISSANTRLNAEAADQGKRNGEIVTAFGNNADAATRVRGSLAQARSLLTQLPGNPSSLLSNETTRPIVAGLFGGVLPSLDAKATNADLFVQAINRAATEMSPKTLVGGERSANINQYRAMLPGLATSPEGRELALNFADDMAENQQRTTDWLTMHKEDPAFMNKRLGVPDLDKALVATRADPSLQMPRLPPMPSSFDAKASAASATDKEAQTRYAASIQPGQPFYAWKPGSDGRLHAVKTTWTRGNDGAWVPVPGSVP